MFCKPSFKQLKASSNINTHPRQGGFTLLEIMVVIVILGIMASLIAPTVLNRVEQSRIQKAKTDISTLSSALDMYQLDNYNYPTTDQGLQALFTPPSGGTGNYPAGGYLKKKSIKDPWQRDYLYRSPGQSGEPYEVYTLGRDGTPGGEGPDADFYSSDE
ncbi:MAG: type II secretion system major pseudopilin GspG [Gammaproteobacteria bacterium]|nr:type II secretion system major pseudopilin GspG [Gammaproteobacteria bacterium]